MNAIRDLDDLARQTGHADGKSFNRWLARQRRQPWHEGQEGEVEARIEHGRWLARCPFCPGAELVSRQTAEFYCFSCAMRDNDGHPMRVLFPEAREDIETVLSLRPGAYQHWQPGDTVEELREMNEDAEIGE